MVKQDACHNFKQTSIKMTHIIDLKLFPSFNLILLFIFTI
jgi:hypothetical protein